MIGIRYAGAVNYGVTMQQDRECCQALSDALDDYSAVLFDVCGGCGIDTSAGKSDCMATSGLWFKFCPFCGKRIVTWIDANGSHWREEQC